MIVVNAHTMIKENLGLKVKFVSKNRNSRL